MGLTMPAGAGWWDPVKQDPSVGTSNFRYRDRTSVAYDLESTAIKFRGSGLESDAQASDIQIEY